MQRQIGQWPRVAEYGFSDDLIDTSLMEEAGASDDFERLLELRRIAQKAFVEHNAQETIKKVRNTRNRVPQESQEFHVGDYVYVFRVPRQRKRRIGGPDFIDRATAKPYWVDSQWMELAYG